MAQIIQHPAIAAAQGKSQKTDMPIADSSFLQHVEYDAQNLQMTITTKSGAQYIYFQVYPQVMQDFIKAPSKGSFYAKMVKGLHPQTTIISKSIGKKISKTT